MKLTTKRQAALDDAKKYSKLHQFVSGSWADWAGEGGSHASITVGWLIGAGLLRKIDDSTVEITDAGRAA